MKKFFLTFVLLNSFFLFSQNLSENAIGLRLGSNDGFGYELSYQRSFGDKNRLEANLGFRNSNDIDAFKAVGLYQWVWQLEGNFNWFAGAGGGLASWSHKHHNTKDTGTYFLGAGNIGVEYHFDFPLMVAIDYRPELYFGDGFSNNFGNDIAISVRYKF